MSDWKPASEPPKVGGKYLVVRYKYVDRLARIAYGWERMVTTCWYNAPQGTYSGGWLGDKTNPVQEWQELPEFQLILDEDQI